MTEEEALHLIKTTPALLSILYNCGALPEQQVASISGTLEWRRLLAYAHAYQVGAKIARERCAQECERVHAESVECPELALYCADAIREIERNK